ncbi:MAG: hypothetical protein CNCCGFBP_01533 [Fimbriimonadaceae bacterium]|nr:hypothetical protein [Fimbriimonadaceae bacterium]
MKTRKHLVIASCAVACAATAFAACPGPTAPQWNGLVGKCVQGFWIRYCQDTELDVDGGCLGNTQNNKCNTSQMSEPKLVYHPQYSGQCTLDQSTNPCVFWYQDGYISYHIGNLDMRFYC